MAGRKGDKSFCFLVLIGILSILQTDACVLDTDCGWRAMCVNKTVCGCPDGYKLHSDQTNCMNESCSSDDCLECADTPTVCTRCASFMSSSSGLCLTKCEGSAEWKGNNFMCTESSDDGEVDIVVAVVAGVGAGMLLCVLVIVGVCIYMRKTRKKINLQTQSYREGQMDVGHVKQFPMFDNSAFESDSHVDYRSGKIDPLHYANELDRLRPHVDTLMVLLSQVKAKTRAMSSSDPRVSTYKGVIHQLCRVLVLLHKKDPVVSIPSDALSLLQWAQQMLDDHREQQSSSGGTAEYPMARISAVDDELQLETPTSPVYATPNDNSFLTGSSPVSQVANPYSSVPVPLPTENTAKKRRSSRNSGYATIRRSASIPNGDIIRSVSDGHHIPDGHYVSDGHQMYSEDGVEPVNVSSFSSPQQGLGLLRKEDFLINNGRTSSDDYSTVDKKKGRDQIDSRRPTRQEPPPEIFNTSSDSYGDIDFSGGYFSPQSQQAQRGNQMSSFERNDEVILRNKNKTVSQVETTPPVKKNIITNPNAIKKPPVSAKPKHLKANPPNIGYFANGHFYDPTPSSVSSEQVNEVVYAPGSSYSERSNVMSTFLGDLPQSRSQSESEQSDDGNADSDNSGGDLDVFPFDPKEATNPVEV